MKTYFYWWSFLYCHARRYRPLQSFATFLLRYLRTRLTETGILSSGPSYSWCSPAYQSLSSSLISSFTSAFGTTTLTNRRVRNLLLLNRLARIWLKDGRGSREDTSFLKEKTNSSENIDNMSRGRQCTI